MLGRFKSLADLEGMGYDEKIITLLPRYGYTHCWILKEWSYHVNTVVALAAEYKKKRSSKAKETWMEETERFWSDRNQYGAACRVAIALEHKKSEVWRKEIRKQRVERMKEKLTELGWEREARSYFMNEPRAFVYRAITLSDDEWTVIQPNLIALMEIEREKFRQQEIGEHIRRRIEKWLKPAFTEFILSQPPNEIYPNILDVALSDEWRTLLCTEPFNEDLPSSSVNSASEQIPNIAKAWRKDRIEYFLEAIRHSKAYSGREVTEDILHLASTIFRCTICQGAGDVLTYPHTLAHSCNFLWVAKPSIHVVPRDTEWAPPAQPSKLDDDLRRPPIVRLYREEERHILTALKRVGIWDGLNPHIVFDDIAHEHMLSMLDALEWNRETTAAEMEERQPYVECLCECYHEPEKRPSRRVFRWKKAIYECKAHSEKEEKREWFSRLNEDEQVKCKQYEADKRLRSTHLNCPWCHDHRNLYLFDKKPDLLRHVSKCDIHMYDKVPVSFHSYSAGTESWNTSSDCWVNDDALFVSLLWFFPAHLSYGLARKGQINVPGITAASKKAVEELLLIDAEKHHCYFRSAGLHNHLSHHLLAAYDLGATASHFKKIYDVEAKIQRPIVLEEKDSTISVNDANWIQYLGNQSAYAAYFSFFSEKVAALGPSSALEKFVFDRSVNDHGNEMLVRMMSGALHPIIQIGYGLEFGNDTLVATGLAQTAIHSATSPEVYCHNFTTDPSSNAVPGISVLEILRKVYDSEALHPVMPYDPRDNALLRIRYKQIAEPHRAKEIRDLVSSFDIDIKGGEKEFASKVEECIWAATLLMVATGKKGKKPRLDFFLMHLVTSSLFLNPFLHALENPVSKANLLRSFLSSVILYTVARGRPRIDPELLLSYTATPRPPKSSLSSSKSTLGSVEEDQDYNPWPAILQDAVYHPDAHVLKTIRTLLYGATHYGTTPAGKAVGAFLNSSSTGQEVESHQGAGKLDGTIFVRAAGMVMDYMGWVVNGQEAREDWDRSALGWDEAWEKDVD
ncbi:hypothetical protein EST38_g8908 [Candolleomyces aberdarensis]|uniref:Uncharacterized protein n=1 Tax=Candolleomyces aberdarensis TaxID=2316362 RepID=A0A4Q2DBA8_9AGAR|nr:hypothetical protein EST38_g8908 [Candolleomyces aberdarensis]